jgi:DNA polymerase elongation subunit (family B)
MEHTFRIFDFNVYNYKDSSNDESDEEVKKYKDNSEFEIQMFGLNEEGATCSIKVKDYKPFFYVLVSDNWSIKVKEEFLAHIKGKIGKYYVDSITECKIIKRKKLYGFDAGKLHKFIRFEFNSLACFNKVKNLWYSGYDRGHKLFANGYFFYNTNIKLYEANIPPLLRLFHIKEISPSGWIALPKNKCMEVKDKTTTCNFEFAISYKHIIPLNDKETPVPYKICSFDIEASSSHGDFPLPIKSYKRLATNIVDYFNSEKKCNKLEYATILTNIILSAFNYSQLDGIDIVYPITPIQNEEQLMVLINKWLEKRVRDLMSTANVSDTLTIEELFEKMAEDDDHNEEEGSFKRDNRTSQYKNKEATVIDIISDNSFDRETKITEMNHSLNCTFPKLQGDKVTFIGSTFMNYGKKEPYKNHCIVLNTCDKLPLENSVLETYDTEREVLLAWQNLIQTENPDIVIGYNIFGFDYPFLFKRAEENNCIEEFLQLSRNKNEICASKDKDTNSYKMEESSIVLASGQHELKYIKMNGRLHVDLYNFYRREAILSSYKLDYVAGHFIGDTIKEFKLIETKTKTVITTVNLTGLLKGSYIHIEEIGHSTEFYNDGEKFLVEKIDKDAKTVTINKAISPDSTKKLRWCLAKDDVTPKDIFRLSNGTSSDRAIVAKYCIQDCNLVHYLFNKSDVLTGFIEMANICSVPINFLVLRGQGIKLTSYIAKKCREKNTLMPVIEKGGMDEGYEGAVVLDPKCDLYLDNPVACVDYASLYPSSMISENLSHDSKVWTREYDLNGVLIEECGDKDKNGNYLYDNLAGYEYVNVTYDTYTYVRKTPASTAKKVKVGTKTCRFAQFQEGKAIMPSILEELLRARKATRKLIPGEKDDFMKQVLEQRQLGYKLTANSLYGQCGAKTSTFYEQDIAACTTAIGRMLLTYAKRVIEETYGNKICDTISNGQVVTKAEYIYGDTDSVFFTFNLQTLEGKPIRGKDALAITIELAQEAGHLASSCLKAPHDLEYEKTFMPFCLLSKKRYVGMLYETDPNKGKRKEMGIVLKRRDNAPLVKDIYGGIIDILMKEQNIDLATKFLKSCLQNIVDEKYPIDKLIITKSLRTGYKKPDSIAHKVLADRITARDPGNKPTSGDRIPYVYFVNSNKKALQRDRIETPAFIIENKLQIDYSFYITNQIMNPVTQLFALVLEKMWENNKKISKIKKFKKEVEDLKRNTPIDKFEAKLEQLKGKEVKALLFDSYIRDTNNKNEGNGMITSYFKF